MDLERGKHELGAISVWRSNGIVEYNEAFAMYSLLNCNVYP